jgi:hypothetical protein
MENTKDRELLKYQGTGSDFVEDYFKRKGIKYNMKVNLGKLNDDPDYKYREADFYLPKYDVYVEFEGRWNTSKEDRERYKIKQEVYKKNKISFVAIYPDNLGILDFYFPKMLQKTLVYSKKKRELNRYRLKLFKERTLGNIILFILFSLFITLGDLTWEKDNVLVCLLSTGIIYQIYIILKFYFRIFRGYDFHYDDND